MVKCVLCPNEASATCVGKLCARCCSHRAKELGICRLVSHRQFRLELEEAAEKATADRDAAGKAPGARDSGGDAASRVGVAVDALTATCSAELCSTTILRSEKCPFCPIHCRLATCFAPVHVEFRSMRSSAVGSPCDKTQGVVQEEHDGVCPCGVGIARHKKKAAGPSALQAPTDDSSIFLRDMELFKLSNVLDNDAVLFKSAVANIVSIMFDKSTSVLKWVDIVGDTLLHRKFQLRPVPEHEASAVGLQLRRMADLGRSVLLAYKLIEKYDYHSAKGTAKEHSLVGRFTYEVPILVVAIETILNRKTKMRVGQTLPLPREFQDDHPLFYGLFAASCPIAEWQVSVPELIEAKGKAWKSQNPELVTDRATWQRKYAATEPAARATTGKDGPQQRDTPTGKKRLNKNQRKKRARERASAGASEADDDDGDSDATSGLASGASSATDTDGGTSTLSASAPSPAGGRGFSRSPASASGGAGQSRGGAPRSILKKRKVQFGKGTK